MTRPLAVVATLLFAHSIGFAGWDQVAALQPGAPILVSSGFQRDAGKFVSATPDAVVLTVRAGDITIPRAEIDSVMIPKTKAQRRKAGIIGATILAGATASILFPAASGLISASRPPGYGLAGLGTGLMGLNGFATGYFRVQTKTIYRGK